MPGKEMKGHPEESDLSAEAWEEYYLNPRYVRQKGTQVYARDWQGGERYNTDGQGGPFYATRTLRTQRDRERQVEYPARDATGEWVFLKDADGDVLYPRICNTQEAYVQTDRGYPVDAKGQPRYPRRKSDGQPVYFRDSQGEVVFIQRDGQPVYATDAEENEIYPKDDEGVPFALWQVVHSFKYPKYAKNKGKDEYYFREGRGDERYLRQGNKEVGAMRRNGDQVHAKRADGLEYYPSVF